MHGVVASRRVQCTILCILLAIVLFRAFRKITIHASDLTIVEWHNLSETQRNELVRLSLNVIVLFPLTKQELVLELKTFWGLYSNNQERPLFLTIDPFNRES